MPGSPGSYHWPSADAADPPEVMIWEVRRAIAAKDSNEVM